MKFFANKTSIDFVGKRKIAFLASLSLIVLSLVMLVIKDLNFGLDFTGGTLIEVSYPAAPEISAVRANLAAAGMPDSIVQTFGTPTDIVVRIPPHENEEESDAAITTVVLEALQQGVEGQVEMRRVEFVGPQVGDELAEQGILAVVYALIGIFFYVMMRFQWRFSVGAVASLVHDIIITMGILVTLQVEFDLTVVAALLAVIGYSLNDTIVVFDRIRENFPRLRKSSPIEVVNKSINETLSRTVMTGLTTLLVLVALLHLRGRDHQLVRVHADHRHSRGYVFVHLRRQHRAAGTGRQQVRPDGGGKGRGGDQPEHPLGFPGRLPLRTDQLFQWRHHLVWRRDDVAGFLERFVAVKIQDHTAGLADDQRAGGHVPRFDPHFKVPVHPARRHPGQVQAGRAGPPEVLDFRKYRLENPRVDLQVLAFPERKCRGQDSSFQPDAGGNPQALVVQEGATATAGSKKFLAQGVVDHGMLGAAIDLLGDGDGEMRQPVQVIAGAVQRVDDPDVFVISGFTAFFAQKSVIRVITLNFPYNFRFASLVHFTDVVVTGLALERNGVHVMDLLAHYFAGGVSGFNRYIQYRMSHVR